MLSYRKTEAESYRINQLLISPLEGDAENKVEGVESPGVVVVEAVVGAAGMEVRVDGVKVSSQPKLCVGLIGVRLCMFTLLLTPR